VRNVPASRKPALRSHWAYISLVPIGFGAWAPIYAGVKARRGLWVGLGLLWSAMVVLALVLSGGHGHSNDGIVGALAIIAWIGGIATSFSIRGPYDRQMSSAFERAVEAGEQRLSDHQRALRLARENPALAREIGVGRPDRAGAADAGLVDVNNASVTALLRLPGIDGDIATEICECREKLGGFASLEDLGATLDLDGGVVEGLRAQVVFLPRGS
jgi:DNA uptake protein ComE-like DNA-binding protein